MRIVSCPAGAVLAALFALLFGCEPAPAEIPCNSNLDCPADMHCNDGLCSRVESATQRDAGLSDAATADIVTTDSAMIDLAASDLAASDLAASDLAASDLAASDLAAPDLAAPDLAASDLVTTDTPVTDSAQVDASVPRLSAAELCALYLSFMTNANQCYETSLGSAQDFTGHELALACRPGKDARLWAEELLAAEAAGKLSIEWGLARSCLDSSRALRADSSAVALLELPAWSALQQGDCHSFYQGAVSVDQPCTRDWDCAAGLGCYTDDPFTSAALRCRPPAALGDRCQEDFFPCDDGLYCTSGNTCASKRASGTTCSSSAACLSGICSNDHCAAMPIELGDSCSPNSRCAGDCMVCRRLTSISQMTCQRRGGRGEFCTSDSHCLGDLDCIGTICDSWPEGSTCGYQSGQHCDPGLSCVTEHDCATITSSSRCSAAWPTCSWDPDRGCQTVQGSCVVELPTRGACLFDWACAPGSCCSPASTLCQPCAELDEPCSEDGLDAPVCAPGLRCREGSCVLICELREDCPGQAYCDTGSGDCLALTQNSCSSDAQCQRDEYCSGTNVCHAKKQPGEICGDDGECGSGICYQYQSNDSRCTVQTDTACGEGADIHTPNMLRAVFLLGSVWFVVGMRRQREE